MQHAGFALAFSFRLPGAPVYGEETAAEEAQYRAYYLRTLPKDAARNPIPAGDGCGKELTHWFRKEVRFPKADTRPVKVLKLNDLPKACRQILTAP